MPDKLDAVVLIRIMRGGDHDASREGPGFGEKCDSGSSSYPGELRHHAVTGQAARKLRCRPRTGFPRIHADDHLGLLVGLEQPSPQCRPYRVGRLVVQGIFASHTTNAIGAKKRTWHYRPPLGAPL